MIRKVLIVDDNQEMLFTLKDGLEKYNDSFSVLISGDGLDAIAKLKKHTISLVVTDLKMPRMDGFSLLNHIIEHFPGIPVILITGYITSEMEQLAQRSGAVGYMEKPFLVDQLAEKIIAILRKQIDGGTLQKVSASMFLQLVEMEQKTCTVRLACAETGRRGILFFRDGQLLDARVRAHQGESAAHEIFRWDSVNLCIENDCPVHERRIQKDVNRIYLEALHRKDEDLASTGPVISQAASQPPSADRPAEISRIRQYLESRVGMRCGLKDVYLDENWEGVITQMQRIGHLLKAGELKIAYLNRNEANDYLLVPGGPPMVMTMDPKCPRERVISALVEQNRLGG
jgi:CheY-like chemotaxis protein